MSHNILDIARASGRGLNGTGSEYMMRCPFPERHKNGDADPACSVNADKGVWFCHSCGARGGVKDLARALGVDGEFNRAEPGRGSVAPEVRAGAAAIHARAAEGLRASAIGQQFLEGRGLSVEVAEGLGIGFLDASQGNDADGVPAGRWITFTYSDGEGPVMLKLRSVSAKNFCRVPVGAPSLLFNSGSIDPAGPVLIVEGEFDVAALETVGFCNVVSVPSGSGTRTDQELLAPLVHVTEVYIATDQDAPGDALALGLAKALGFHCCRRVRFGKHKDANDALMAGASPEDFQRWLEEAKPMQDESWPEPKPFMADIDVPFPAETLPGWLANMVDSVATATQTPVDLPGIVALGVLSAACAGKVKVHGCGDHVEPVNLYLAAFMDPANRKSQVVKEFTGVLDLYAGTTNAKRNGTRSEVTARRRALAAKIKAEEKLAADMAETAKRPQAEQAVEALQRELDALADVPEFRMYTSDCTPEKLVDVMSQQRGVLSVFDTEGTFISVVSGRYASKHVPNIEAVQKAHCGDTINVDRKVGRSITIYSPALTVCMVAQPDVLEQMGRTPGFQDRGFNARFLFTVPTSLIGRREIGAPPVPAAHRLAYTESVLRLLNLEQPPEKSGLPNPYLLQLTSGALALHFQHASETEARLAEGGDFRPLLAWAGKLVGAVLRLAGLLHMGLQSNHFHSTAEPITEATIAHAWRLGGYFVAHAKHVFSRIGGDVPHTLLQYVLSVIKRAGLRAFSARDLHQKVKGRILTMPELDPVLEALVYHNYLREQDGPHRAGPGRPGSQKYEVNPRWLGANVPDSSPASGAATSLPDAVLAPRPGGPTEFDASELLADFLEGEQP
jgi:replicative DNA helicase